MMVFKFTYLKQMDEELKQKVEIGVEEEQAIEKEKVNPEDEVIEKLNIGDTDVPLPSQEESALLENIAKKGKNSVS
jgi:hypothetical protein